MCILKKYKIELELFIILMFILYFLPINGYMFKELDISNILFVIYPISYFLCATIEGKHSGNFYIFPIISSIFYIPLAFTIFETTYLPCYFIYLFIGLLGGLFGVWCHNNEELRKSFKKALGVLSIVAIIFIVLFNIIYIFFYECANYYCEISDFLNASTIQTILVIALLVLLAVYCFRKKKKKKE